MKTAKIRRSSVSWRVILSRDICAYCGGPPETVDHIQPLSAGGVNTWENLTPACKECNTRKASLSLLIYLLKAKEGWPFSHRFEWCRPIVPVSVTIWSEINTNKP